MDSFTPKTMVLTPKWQLNDEKLLIYSTSKATAAILDAIKNNTFSKVRFS